MNIDSVVSRGLIDRIDHLRQSYQSADPFPHIVIDDFFTPQTAEFLSTGFPAMEHMPTIFKEPMSYKGQLSGIADKWPTFAPVFSVLQSQEFRNLMSRLSGIERLLDDPALAGGGLHQSPRSGFLDIHVDANYHPFDKALHRRLNLLVYVTRDWKEEWGGALQLWSDKSKKPDALIKPVPPKFNRGVLFSTTRTSWHGVGPVSCPEGISRKSVALYYYTTSRPDEEVYQDTSVIWMNKTIPWKQAFYPLLNASIAILKPYAKYFRRKSVFDSVTKR